MSGLEISNDAALIIKNRKPNHEDNLSLEELIKIEIISVLNKDYNIRISFLRNEFSNICENSLAKTFLR